MDDSRQPRDQLFAEDRYGLYQVTDAAPDNWAKVGDRFVLAEKLAGEVFKQARVESLRRLRGRRRPTIWRTRWRIRCKRIAATNSTCRCSTAIMSPTMPAPASCTQRRAMAARISTSGPRMRARWRSAASTPRIPYTVDENGAFTEQAPGFTGKRVITDKGEKGDANEAVIKALSRGRHADRARPPQAPIPAFLALEEAGDLPQHAAMVHRDGQAVRERRRASRRYLRGSSATLRDTRSRDQPPAGCRRRARTASPA